MPSQVLKQVSTQLISTPVRKDQQRIYEEYEAIWSLRVDLIEVAHDINGDVAPKEEAPQVDHQNDTTDDGTDTLPVPLCCRILVDQGFSQVLIHDAVLLNINSP